MLTVSRQERESIIIYSDEPEITNQLGNGCEEIVVAKVDAGEQCRTVLAILEPKGGQILRGDQST